MKLWFTIFLLLVSLVTYGQVKLTGKYCSPYDFLGSCLTLKSDNTFDYSWWSCLGDKAGKGTFEVVNDKLVVKFINDDTVKNTIEIKETKCSYPDSVLINFLILDGMSKTPLPFANVWLPDFPANDGRTSSNVDGELTLKVERSTKEVQVIVTYVGFRWYSFNVTIGSCMDITVSLNSTSNFIAENGTKWEYEIIETGRNKLALQNVETEILLTKVKK